MRRALKPLAAALTLPLAIAATPALSSAATSGDNMTHDPSRMIESDGRFYVYSTGGGSKSSADGLVWTNGPAIFPGGSIPNTTTSVVSNNEGVWAPDVIFVNGEYYLYYSIANAQNECAIGLVTSPTLNPSAANYKWTDRGLVISNTGSATYCTIDPAPLVDATGNLWLAWGSGYNPKDNSTTIFVTRLDNTTGLASAGSTKPGYPLVPGHIEASYIYYHTGYYYLFWNSGGCCKGAQSNYLIHVARSQTVTGPYTAATKDFYGSTGSIHGPGHIGIYDECGASRFTYHYYPDTGQSVLGENELSWGSDGWPVVGPASTTPLKACGQTGGGAAGAGGAGGAGGNLGTGGNVGAAGGGVAQGGAAGVDSGGSVSGGAPTGGGGGPADIAGAPNAGGVSGSEQQAGGGPGTAGSNSAGNGGVLAPTAGSAAATDGSPASGCSCMIGGKGGSQNSAAGLLLVGVLLEGARRRRRSRP